MSAFNEQDVEAWLAALHSECQIEFVGGFDAVIGERFEGQEGARRFFEDWFAAFDTGTWRSSERSRRASAS